MASIRMKHVKLKKKKLNTLNNNVFYMGVIRHAGILVEENRVEDYRPIMKQLWINFIV